MHELSITNELVKTVEEALRGAACDLPLKRVNVVVGRLSGVSPDCLKFYFKMLTEEKPQLASAEIIIDIQQIEVVCMKCNKGFDAGESVIVCPECGSADVDITKGRELMVESIEVDDGGEQLENTGD